MRFLFSALLAVLFTLAPVAYAQDSTTAPGVTVTDSSPIPDTTETVVVQSESGTTNDISSDTTVVIPYGNWIDSLLGNLFGVVSSIIAILVAFAGRHLPKWIGDLLLTMKAEQLLTRAAEYGINATRGAVVGKSLELNVGNEAVAKGAQYAIDNGPKFLIDWLGGPEAIRDKMIARIPLAADVGAQDIRL